MLSHLVNSKKNATFALAKQFLKLTHSVCRPTATCINGTCCSARSRGTYVMLHTTKYEPVTTPHDDEHDVTLRMIDERSNLSGPNFKGTHLSGLSSAVMAHQQLWGGHYGMGLTLLVCWYEPCCRLLLATSWALRHDTVDVRAVIKRCSVMMLW